MLYIEKILTKKNENTLWTWHKYVLNYWQIDNRLLDSVSTQPPPRKDVRTKFSEEAKPRQRWAIQRGMRGRLEGTSWGRRQSRTARVLRRFLSSLCSTSLILISPWQVFNISFFNISQHFALFRRLMSILRIVRRWHMLLRLRCCFCSHDRQLWPHRRHSRWSRCSTWSEGAMWMGREPRRTTQVLRRFSPSLFYMNIVL